MSQKLLDIKKNLLQARKNKDILTIKVLSTLVGELETMAKKDMVITDEVVIKLISKFLKNNKKTLDVVKDERKIQELILENDILLNQGI